MGSASWVLSIVPSWQKKKTYEKSSDKLNQGQSIEGGDISTHTHTHATDAAVSFWVWPTDSGAFETAGRCRMIKSQPASEAFGSEKGWAGSFCAAGCSAQLWLRLRFDFGHLRFLCLHLTPAARPQTTKINLNRHRGGLRAIASLQGGLQLPVADLSIPHPLMGTAYERENFDKFEMNRHYVDRFYWPSIIPQEKTTTRTRGIQKKHTQNKKRCTYSVHDFRIQYSLEKKTVHK